MPHRAGLGVKLLSLAREKILGTLGLGALGAALGAAITGLGFVCLRAREALLGLSPGLSYPRQEWLATGFEALGALFWRGLSVLASDDRVLQRSAWALLLLLFGLVLVARPGRGPALLLGALVASSLLLFAGSGVYRVALAANASVTKSPSGGFHCQQEVTANLADRVAFETCSWLVNDSARNDQRRSDLGGLLGWLLAACLAAVVAGARAAVGSRQLSRLRWALVGIHSLLALLLLHDLPRAHAFGTWGLRYPQVQIQRRCDAALAQATMAGTCWAFDVSANAEKRTILLQGRDCPEGRGGTFQRLGEDCLVTSSSPRVIAYGPTP